MESVRLEGELILGLEYIYGDCYFVVSTGDAREPKFEPTKLFLNCISPNIVFKCSMTHSEVLRKFSIYVKAYQ